MSPLAQEAVRILESLPPDKAQAVLEYARYLAEKADDEEWDRLVSDPKYAAKLTALMQDVERQIASQATEPLDPGRL